MAQLPDHGITVSKVAQTLGVTSTDVGKLCICHTINKWSKQKPVKFDKQTGLTAADFKSAHYGLVVPYAFSDDMSASRYYTLSEVRKMMKPEMNWGYQRPEGGEHSPYRLGDFRCYEHGSIPVLYSNYPLSRNNPHTVKWLLQNNQLRCNIFFNSSQDDGANQWNLKMSDLEFSVFNEQSSSVYLKEAHLICAVFEGHINPFASDGTISAVPIKWIVNKYPTTNSNGYGLNFRLNATAFETDGSFNIFRDTMTEKTLVFMLGINFNYTSANFREYDDMNPYTWTSTSSTKYPSYCVACPFDSQNWPVVWLDEWAPANLKPFASDIESGQVRYIKFSETTGRQWYTLDYTGTYAKAIGPMKYWSDTFDAELLLYNGNTNTGSDYKLGLSIVIYNNGENANDFYYRRLYRRISGVDPADIIFLNENQNAKTVTASTKETIPAGGSIRLYMWIPGFVLTSSKFRNSIRFEYEDPIAGFYDICTVTFKFTNDSRFNPDA